MNTRTKPGLDEAVLREIQSTGGNLSRVASALGVNYQAVRMRFGQPVSLTPALPVNTAEPTDIRTLARPQMRKYVIAVKRAGGEWPEKYEDVIQQHRRMYDAGSVEMTQSNSKGWVVLYSIPRLVKRKTGLNYFSSMGFQF